MSRTLAFLALAFLLALAALAAAAEPPCAEEIVRRLEANRLFETERVEGSLIITDRFGSRIKTFVSYAAGEDRMLIAFTNPEEKGQKILRLKNDIYLYFPEAEGVVRLQGAALKESVMGSDFSYEDLTGEKSLLARYTASLLGTERLEGREHYLLELKAKERGVAYPLEKLWVDAGLFLLRRAEYYALSGKLLKSLELGEFQRIGGRHMAMQAVMRDHRKKASSTEFRIQKVRIDEPLPKGIFSLEALSW